MRDRVWGSYLKLKGPPPLHEDTHVAKSPKGMEMQRELLRLVTPYLRMQGQSTSEDMDAEGEICDSSGTKIEGQSGLGT